MTNRSGLTALLVVLAVVVATVPAGALPALSTDASATASQDGGANASNASLGASVSGFMQASAADAEGEVEDGMFSARFNDASAENRRDLVNARAGTLEKRLEDLRAQRAELLDSTDGEPTVAERAKAARLAARIDALEESIDTTSEAAERAGVDVSRLAELRASASELTGPEVAELARGLAGGPDIAAGDAPTDRSGGVNETNTTDAAGNASDSPSSSGDGPGNSGSDRGNSEKGGSAENDTTGGADTSDN